MRQATGEQTTSLPHLKHTQCHLWGDVKITRSYLFSYQQAENLSKCENDEKRFREPRKKRRNLYGLNTLYNGVVDPDDPDPYPTFKTGHLNNWQIFCVRNETAARPLKYFKDFLKKNVPIRNKKTNGTFLKKN
jgi:hypothetical protein